MMPYFLGIFLSAEKDVSGVYGSIFHYAFIIAFSGSALIIFLYLWSKGRLDADEEPKFQMMMDDEQRKNNERP